MNHKIIVIPFFIVFGIWFVQNHLPVVWWGGVLVVDSILGRPNIPYEDRSISITGKDENKNGVRDDIERFLNENIGEYSYNVRMAHHEYAKAHLALLTTDPKNLEAMKKANNNIMYRTHCRKFFSDSMTNEDKSNLRKVSEKIRYLVINTSARENRYRKSYNPNLNESKYSSYLTSRISMVCGFNVKKKNQAIAKRLYHGNASLISVKHKTDLMLKKYPDYFSKKDKNEVIKNFNAIIDSQ